VKIQRPSWFRLLNFAASLTATIAYLPSQADAQTSAEATFYKGKSITLVIGFDVGGGYDAIARVLSPFLTTHLPGNPSVVPTNKPGAGSLVAALNIYQIAPRDGTYIATVGRSVPLQPLLVPDKANFDARELSWIGSVGQDTLLCVSWHTSPIKSLNDLLTQPFSVGGSGTGSDTTVQAQALKHLLGAKIKLVGPYRGTNDINLAMERGEVDGYCGFSWSTLKSQNADWLRDKKVNILLQLALEKNADLPDVPIIGDLLSPGQRSVFQLLVGTQNIARPFFAPPGLPPARKQTLRDAFNAAVSDARFREEAQRLSLEVELLKGEEIDRMMKELYATPKDLIEQAASLMR
jgi:tripartite-type tricarboxylate transporter receptor subunit TctC